MDYDLCRKPISLGRIGDFSFEIGCKDTTFFLIGKKFFSRKIKKFCISLYIS